MSVRTSMSARFQPRNESGQFCLLRGPDRRDRTRVRVDRLEYDIEDEARREEETRRRRTDKLRRRRRSRVVRHLSAPTVTCERSNALRATARHTGRTGHQSP